MASDTDETSLYFDSNGCTSRPDLYNIELLLNEVAKEDAYFFRSDDFIADTALGLRVRRGNEHLSELLMPKIRVVPTLTHSLMKTVRKYASWNVKQGINGVRINVMSVIIDSGSDHSYFPDPPSQFPHYS